VSAGVAVSSDAAAFCVWAPGNRGVDRIIDLRAVTGGEIAADVGAGRKPPSLKFGDTLLGREPISG